MADYGLMYTISTAVLTAAADHAENMISPTEILVSVRNMYIVSTERLLLRHDIVYSYNIVNHLEHSNKYKVWNVKYKKFRQRRS